MRNISDAAFSITAAYADTQTDAKAEAAAESIPHMRHFYWGDVSIVNAKKVADLSALANSPLEDFRLYNVQVTGAKTGIVCENAKDVVLEEIALQPLSGPAVEARNVTNLEVFRLAVEKPNEGAPVLLFNGVAQARLHGCKVAAGPGDFVRCSGATSEDITMESNRLAAGVKEREP